MLSWTDWFNRSERYPRALRTPKIITFLKFAQLFAHNRVFGISIGVVRGNGILSRVNGLILGGGVSFISPQKHSFVTSSFGAPWLEFFLVPYSLELSTLLSLPHFHSSERFD
jgi:hypothetical protein